MNAGSAEISFPMGADDTVVDVVMQYVNVDSERNDDEVGYLLDRLEEQGVLKNGFRDLVWARIGAVRDEIKRSRGIVSAEEQAERVAENLESVRTLVADEGTDVDAIVEAYFNSHWGSRSNESDGLLMNAIMRRGTLEQKVRTLGRYWGESDGTHYDRLVEDVLREIGGDLDAVTKVYKAVHKKGAFLGVLLKKCDIDALLDLMEYRIGVDEELSTRIIDRILELGGVEALVERFKSLDWGSERQQDLLTSMIYSDHKDTTLDEMLSLIDDGVPLQRFDHICPLLKTHYMALAIRSRIHTVKKHLG